MPTMRANRLLISFCLLCSVSAGKLFSDEVSQNRSSGRVLLDSPVNRIVTDAIEYGRLKMIQHGPFFIGSSEQTVLGDANQLNVKLSNVTVFKAGEFLVSSVDNSMLSMWTRMRINYPSLHVEGNFEIDGTIRNTTASGQGAFSGDIEGLDLSLFVQFRLMKYYLQVRKADLDYVIKNVKFTAKGLSVQGLSDNETEILLNETLLNLLDNNKDFISSSFSQKLMSAINESIKGKSLFELIAWLKGIGSEASSSTHLVLRH